MRRRINFIRSLIIKSALAISFVMFISIRICVLVFLSNHKVSKTMESNVFQL